MDEDKQEIEMIDIQLLKSHPKNKEIYGQEDIINLAESIKKNGLKNPLLVNQNNIIISGHRRTYACIYLGIKEVPIIRIEFKNENEELERLLLENEYREKTMTQKVEEGLMWEEIEKKKAKQRKIATQNNNKAKAEVDNVPQQVEQGKTRDIVSEKVDIGSGRTYTRAKIAVIET